MNCISMLQGSARGARGSKGWGDVRGTGSKALNVPVWKEEWGRPGEVWEGSDGQRVRRRCIRPVVSRQPQPLLESPDERCFGSSRIMRFALYNCLLCQLQIQDRDYPRADQDRVRVPFDQGQAPEWSRCNGGTLAMTRFMMTQAYLLAIAQPATHNIPMN